MILGIGIDIVHVPRIVQLVSRRGRERFAKRILSQQEHVEFYEKFPRSACQDNDQLQYLVSRWCVKEAVYKALYPRHKLVWKDVTVWKDRGKPMLSIMNGTEYGIMHSHLSLSHDGEYTTAMVILES
ncbi:4'-phosphopantetheinyl transferase [Hesseltinella vesiculosa]|uniref:4'-phosphopantetheinyl transferase n=1 Tax=Hesseltinella vesiculosa TaxID=101127 RepID=A0A1X2GBU0_9FUNG|nr:4'-phosphopantetheinyl transferase [Hesseltinella vesiculosa]